MFADDGSVPNNPRLPFLVYRGAIDLNGSPDPEERDRDARSRRNGWGDMWRNGIYPYVHYHSMIHEGMGIARGRAKVRFGGNNGREVEIAAGRRLRAAGRHRPSVPVGEPRPDGDRRLSAERKVRSLPRQQGRARQGDQHHPEVPLPDDRSGVRRRRPAAPALAPPRTAFASSIRDWIEFWDTAHSIYVNARHATAHFRRIAEDLARLVRRARSCSTTAAARRCTPTSSPRRRSA